MKPNDFASELTSIYGGSLESIILYGSAAGGDFHKGHSNYNIAIVLKNLAPLEIAKSNEIIKKWVGKGNPPPLLFTREMIKTASDVFPIEFYDIVERHHVIYGGDAFADVKIDPKNLRHQLEYELRSKLLSLRSQFALIADRPKEVINLILKSSSSFFAIFKGVLRLANISPPLSKKAIAERLAGLTGLDPAIFIEIVDVLDGTRIWRKEDAQEKFEQYLTSIETVVRYIDKL